MVADVHDSSDPVWETPVTRFQGSGKDEVTDFATEFYLSRKGGKKMGSKSFQVTHYSLGEK